MKKTLLFAVTLLSAVLGLMSSCSNDDDILFDHEQPAFPIQADKILLEAIMPTATSAEEDVYIVGAFNGLDDESVIGNEAYKLMLSDSVPAKRGIYIDPVKFVNGKSLADGYHFVSSTQRNEVTAQGDTVVRNDNPSVGTRTNVYVSKWAAYFDPAPTEPEHDGYVVYVDNQTSWGDDITMYMWGDVNDLNSPWPGMKPTGKETKNGITYTYFDMGAANSGLTEHLIFSNNGASQLPDFAYTIDHDLYLRVTDAGVEEITNEPQHDGFAVFVDNQTSWGDAITLYMWGDVNDLNGGWPGMKPTGTQVKNGVTYTYFDMGAANTGLTEHLIFSNNGASQLSDIAYTIDHDLYLKVTDSGVEEITQGGTGTTAGYKLYIDNQTGWASTALYVWGDQELFGTWPGAQPAKTETVGGITYQVWEIGDDNATYHPILNDNGGSNQLDSPTAITASRDYYYKVTSSGWTEITPANAKSKAAMLRPLANARR